MVDSLGRDALQIIIVLVPGSADNISGAEVLRTLVETNHTLQEAGEKRFFIIRHRTDESLPTMPPPDPLHLFEQADELITAARPEGPHQEDLRRAISAPYYGVCSTLLQPLLPT
jgi:hypothetical protein